MKMFTQSLMLSLILLVQSTARADLEVVFLPRGTEIQIPIYEDITVTPKQTGTVLCQADLKEGTTATNQHFAKIEVLHTPSLDNRIIRAGSLFKVVVSEGVHSVQSDGPATYLLDWVYTYESGGTSSTSRMGAYLKRARRTPTRSNFPVGATAGELKELLSACGGSLTIPPSIEFKL